MTDFADLLVELEDLQKARMPAEKDVGNGDGDAGEGTSATSKKDGKAPAVGDAKDDKNIKAAAKDGQDEGAKDEESFGKAFKVKLEDGTETEAFDGTAMLKALHDENGDLRETIGDLQKGFELAIDVIKNLRTTAGEQGALLKSLGTKVSGLSTAGTGRRTMLTIAEKLTPGTPGAAPDDGKPTAGAVMMKAQFMARKGDLDWGSLPRIEAYQGRGQLAPADLLARFPELLTPIT